MTREARLVEGGRLVCNVVMRVVAPRACELSESLVETTAQDDALAGEADAVRRLFQQGQSVEIIVPRRVSVACPAHLRLLESWQRIGVEDRSVHGLTIHRGFDVCPARAVAALAANPHFVRRGSRGVSVVSGCVAAEAFNHLLGGQPPPEALDNILRVVLRRPGGEVYRTETLIPSQPALHPAAGVGAANGRDPLRSAAEGPLEHGPARFLGIGRFEPDPALRVVGECQREARNAVKSTERQGARKFRHQASPPKGASVVAQALAGIDVLVASLAGLRTAVLGLVLPESRGIA